MIESIGAVRACPFSGEREGVIHGAASVIESFALLHPAHPAYRRYRDT